MSHKITEEFVKFKAEHISENGIDLEAIFNHPHARQFKYQLDFRGRKTTHKHEHWFITLDDGDIAIKYPLTKEEQKLYYQRMYVSDNTGISYGKNYIRVSFEEFLEDARIRIMGAKNWNKWCDVIKVGDFVQFTGQRDAASWRKIVAIEWKWATIHGYKYSQPINDPKYDERHDSYNGIVTLKNYKANPDS